MKTSRRGFTLVELLTVVAIIGILSAIGTAAAFKVISLRQQKNTEASLDKLASLLRQGMAQTIDAARKEKIPPAVLALAGNDPDRALVIWIKLRLRQQFPQSYAQARNPAPGYLAAEPAYVNRLGTLTAANNPATESAACLLMALTEVDRGGSSIHADLLTALEKRDTDADGIPEIIDGWGAHIVFVLWATTAPDPNPTATFHDVQDPYGRLQVPAWSGSASGATFQSLCHPIVNQYLVPAFISAGPDTNQTTTADNITVYVQQ